MKNEDFKKLLFVDLVPFAMVEDLTSTLLNSSTAYITWSFEPSEFRLLNGKFRSFAVAIYEDFSKNYRKYLLINYFSL
jgi:hypothetical protein